MEEKQVETRKQNRNVKALEQDAGPAAHSSAIRNGVSGDMLSPR